MSRAARASMLLLLALASGTACDATLRAGGADGDAAPARDLGPNDADAGPAIPDRGAPPGDGRAPGGDTTVAAPDAAAADADAGSTINPNALFVSTSGSDVNDGRTRGTALRTIAHAAQLALAGETIYVEAGDYGAEQVVFANQGTAAAPIALEGYRSTPGDRPSIAGFDNTSALDPSLMPLLDGGDRSQGTAIDLGGRQHVTVRNLQLRNYLNGVYAWGARFVTVDTLYLSTFGENDDAAYSGKGIIFGSNAASCTARNSVVVNAGAEGIMLYGDDNRVESCRVYGDDAGGTNLNSPDYYIMAAGNGNVIEGSLVRRIGDLWHGGHGIGLKGTCTGNTIRNNVCEGFAGGCYYARHRGVVNNLFVDNVARDGGLALCFRDGASGNTVDNLRTENVAGGVYFFDTTEDGDKQFSGNDNVVRNSTFRNTVGAVIWLHDYVYNDVYARRNTFEQLVIDGAPALFEVRSFGEDNKLVSSSISNVASFAVVKAPRTLDDLGFSFAGNTGSGNGFTLP